MDTKRIFEDLQEYSKDITGDQKNIFDNLMSAISTKGFSGIPAEEVRRIQEYLFISHSESDKINQIKKIINYLNPAHSDAPFI
jgi:hypothetical protein